MVLGGRGGRSRSRKTAIVSPLEAPRAGGAQEVPQSPPVVICASPPHTHTHSCPPLPLRGLHHVKLPPQGLCTCPARRLHSSARSVCLLWAWLPSHLLSKPRAPTADRPPHPFALPALSSPHLLPAFVLILFGVCFLPGVGHPYVRRCFVCFVLCCILGSQRRAVHMVDEWRATDCLHTGNGPCDPQGAKSWMFSLL